MAAKPTEQMSDIPRITTSDQLSDLQEVHITDSRPLKKGKMSGESVIDEDLQSRQLAVYGRANMKKLAAARIFISGLNGLGAEIAKNVILANVNMVTLHDTKNAQKADLGSNFYLSEQDIGKNRASAVLKDMQELNPSVEVHCSNEALTADLIKKNAYSVVVFVDVPLNKCTEINNWCHAQNPPVHFIRADVRGLFGMAFCDFGPGFVVEDTTGEPARTVIIESISKGNPALVKCIFDEEGRHELQDGDQVVFSEIKGMTELNGPEHHKVKAVVNPYSFEIDEDTASYGDYLTGGLVTQAKVPKVLNPKTLQESQSDPGEFLESDFSKFGRSVLLHLGYRAIDQFQLENGHYPKIRNNQDAQKVLSIAKSINESAPEALKLEEINEKIILNLSLTCETCINPMAALFGGFVGQEVVKACTGKFHPLDQYFYYDALECIDLEKDLGEDEYVIGESRYADQVAVFGKSFQEKLSKLRIFLVGAGALGCEFIKDFALMGVADHSEGQVIVTDDDVIERSNLTRQFLFRNWNIGQNKAAAAAKVAKSMNPSFNIKDMQERVSPDTEDIFDDTFWSNLSLVCNALDNVKARLYVDSRCVFFNKPLLESGTLGTKCNVQVVVPHKTENYGASVDPPEKEAPQCTIHNFPHNIDHCLIWARSEFVGNFDTDPKETSNYLKKGDKYLDELRSAGTAPQEILQKLRGDELWGGGIKDVVSKPCLSFLDCVQWAREKFEVFAVNVIKQLVYTFPKDAKNNKTGKAFWSPPKRFPEPLSFDTNEKLHMDFIIAAANLRAKTCGVELPSENRNPIFFKTLLEKCKVPKFEPKSGIRLETGDEENDGEGSGPAAGSVEDVFTSLPSNTDLVSNGLKEMWPEEFEKDDDSNFHIDYICSLANIRARNYGITEVDKLQAKLRAGRIIPAIATTTAMVTGFVCLELYKLVENLPIERFRNAFANLALPLFALSEPILPKKVVSRTEKFCPDPLNHPDYVEENEVKAYPDPHTIWDSITVDCGAMTLREFIEYFKKEHGIELQSIAHGSSLVYSNFMPTHQSRLDKDLKELVCTIDKCEFGNRKYMLPVCAFGDDMGNDVDVPRIIYYHGSE